MTVASSCDFAYASCPSACSRSPLARAISSCRGPILASLNDCSSEWTFCWSGLILCRGVIERLFGEDTLSCQVASTIERNFVVRRGSAGLSQVVLGLLDFLGTGAIL